MDPQSLSFTPRDDLWRFQSDMMRIQQTQAEHAERIHRIERRQDEDARMRSVWGNTSPFPSVLTGTPQQGRGHQNCRWKPELTAPLVPIHHPSADVFDNFEDQQNNLLGSLHLDAEDEPRRIGSASRANSVRFDESANQGHWSQNSRTSIDFIHRTGSGMGGLAMTERSSSHKSDGRQSSAGQSVHSGRPNYLALDVNASATDSTNTTMDNLGLIPGLLVLGPVPSIIRCWLTTNFRHDSLLYAAVCTGSYASTLHVHFVEYLGLEEGIREDEDGARRIKLPMYLPEAVSYQPSSRSGSPVPQLPTLTVDFKIMENERAADPRAIQIIIGSDVLRARNADILLSLNKLTLLDDERNKLSVPLVRPEDERTFKSLLVRSSLPHAQSNGKVKDTEMQYTSDPESKREDSRQKDSDLSDRSTRAHSLVGIGAGDGSGRADTFHRNSDATDKADELGSKSQRLFFRGSAKQNSKEESSFGESTNTAYVRESPSMNLWSNWRRDGDKQSQLDWASAGKSQPSGYQRRDVGIKVLKPARSTPRTLSSSHVSALSPGAGQSRFFDEGRRSSAAVGDSTESDSKRSVSSEAQSIPRDKEKENQLGANKSRPANPVGGASAFAWLNPGSLK